MVTHFGTQDSVLKRDTMILSVFFEKKEKKKGSALKELAVLYAECQILFSFLRVHLCPHEHFDLSGFNGLLSSCEYQRAETFANCALV